MQILTSPFLPAVCAFIAVTLATLVIVDFFSYVSGRYKERYLKEAAVELDDVLLQMPPSRVFDFSLAISGIAAFMTFGFYAAGSGAFALPKGIFLSLLVAVISFPAPRLILRFIRKKRLEKFNEQLEDALNSIASSLKAGFSINQALESIAAENKRPISVEFRLLVQEIRLGVSLDKALDNMCGRLGSDDMELIATAIITARQTGGELTAILERLAGVIRERVRINNRLRAMTAQGKLQAALIGIMPFALLFMMCKIVPDTMDHFFGSLVGIFSLILVCGMVITGALVIKKITTIDI
ncbi:type II secretion system F family protein [Lentisphaerota bacterium ZTH]|nr:type II secretion system F family protein [Lentisphaerota bacterium]WET06860.1 type II secretion system F family protein [Lentisphaerota bacterium ZTH]